MFLEWRIWKMHIVQIFLPVYWLTATFSVFRLIWRPSLQRSRLERKVYCFQTDRLGLQSGICYFLVGWPWASDIMFVKLGFFICKVKGQIIPISLVAVRLKEITFVKFLAYNDPVPVISRPLFHSSSSSGFSQGFIFWEGRNSIQIIF